MHISLIPTFFPRQLWAFSVVYFAASLIHFAHNAESIWFEAISGVALAVCCAFVIRHRHAIQEP